VIERSFILCHEGMIEMKYLPEELTIPHPSTSLIPDFQKARVALESQLILNALKKNDNNRERAAKELGVHKTTLLRRMKRMGIPFPASDGRSTRKS